MADFTFGTPINLGPTVNSSNNEAAPCISADGLSLYFTSNRTGGFGLVDIWLTRRVLPNGSWDIPINVGPIVNTSAGDGAPSISFDGSTTYFTSNRFGGLGDWDLWQTPIIPIVDLNGDGIVDSADVVIIVDNWGTDNSLCDIGPMPWGDGIVDVEDLKVLAEHLFEVLPGRRINP